MAITFKEQFTGFCRHCDKPVLDDAEFCHHCGKLLRKDISDEAQFEEAQVNTEQVQALLKETNHLFLIWSCCISFMGASAINYFVYHNAALPIIAACGLAYVWLFLTARLDELARSLNKNPGFVYASLLFPLIGTILSFYHLSQQTQNKLGTLD